MRLRDLFKREMESTALKGRFMFVVTISLALLVTGCSTAHSDTTVHSATPVKYYVSLGDSYSVGYQPSPTPGPTAGYTTYVAQKENLKLENFGCSGATTDSILHTNGCTAPYGPVADTDAVPYTTMSQAAAAEAFIRAHKGSIGLITVSIGGDDITSCVTAVKPHLLRAHGPRHHQGQRHRPDPPAPLGCRCRGAHHRAHLSRRFPSGLWVYPPGKTDHGWPPVGDRLPEPFQPGPKNGLHRGRRQVPRHHGSHRRLLTTYRPDDAGALWADPHGGGPSMHAHLVLLTGPHPCQHCGLHLYRPTDRYRVRQVVTLLDGPIVTACASAPTTDATLPSGRRRP